MIAKQVTGVDFWGCLDYLQNKEGAYFIGGNMVGREPAALSAEFRVSTDLRRTISKPVYHVSLAVSPLENLADVRWREIARAFLKGMEFEGSQYVAYRHTDRKHDHVHIVASRVRITDGTPVSDSWNHTRAEKLVRKLEQQFGLTPTTPSWEKSVRSPKTGEIRRQRRTGEEPERVKLQRTIQECLEGAPTQEQFLSRLRKNNVSVRFKQAQDGNILGISYKLDKIAFQGNKLGRAFSWNGIQQQLKKATVPEATVSKSPSKQPLPLAIEQPQTLELSDEESIVARERERYRQKYLALSQQARQHPKLQGRPEQDIDTAVALLSLNETRSIDEAKKVLTQSDRVLNWRRCLTEQEYKERSIEYINQIAQRAEQLRAPLKYEQKEAHQR